MLERTPLVCPACVERAEAEDARLEREREAQEIAQRVEARRRASGLPPQLRGHTWQDLSADTPPGVLAAAKAWAAGEIAGLVLGGPVGVGKTYVASVAAEAWLDRGPLRWFSVPVLFARLGLAFADDGRQDALDVLSGRTALVLDDIDKARPSQYAAEQLFCAIDTRVTHGAQLLVTTNLELDELADRYGPAIVSRLAGYCEAFAMDGPDRRIERRFAR
jgi:DNA replication protein DnaC